MEERRLSLSWGRRKGRRKGGREGGTEGGGRKKGGGSKGGREGRREGEGRRGEGARRGREGKISPGTPRPDSIVLPSSIHVIPNDQISTCMCVHVRNTSIPHAGDKVISLGDH